MMVVGLLTAELAIDGADSLKDKRQVLKSLLARLRNSFNVSAAEVDENDIWRRATVGVAVVANEAGFVQEVLAKVVNFLQSDPRIDLGHFEIELL